MCNMIIQQVSKTEIKTTYEDVELKVNCTDRLLEELEKYVTQTSAVIVQRIDVQRLADEIANNINESPNYIFKRIKQDIRSRFDVQRLKFNPRTLVYMPKSKAFIINLRTYIKK